MNIAFKPKGQKESTRFYFETSMLQDFCAWDIIYGFGENDNDRWWDDDEDLAGGKPIAESRLFKAVLAEAMQGAAFGTTYFIGDEKSGIADQYLFPYIPKRAFNVKVKKDRYDDKLGRYVPKEEIVKCKAVLSPYYHNPNSGNKVRHAIITTQPVKEKK